MTHEILAFDAFGPPLATPFHQRFDCHIGWLVVLCCVVLCLWVGGLLVSMADAIQEYIRCCHCRHGMLGLNHSYMPGDEEKVRLHHFKYTYPMCVYVRTMSFWKRTQAFLVCDNGKEALRKVENKQQTDFRTRTAVGNKTHKRT